ncbi:biotin/methionine sulfoxide reductase [Propionibacteriaceae bacterium ES.041]|uniref:molybdopterin-dependent oxidoreductase n=1 Tax=Enemella evansiae TaxID=2016499 RepID=UPI000B977FCE|nr:molybdopterin-dependent oxidoreductase [Enemella evansiae]OYN98876.1 hypothetical protein CGZ96_06235 [Enemella evansiae]PFG67627.1 biotin/methionine sulfoxide reductase [Propionibacteriaceae bacterium ES.041]
MAGTRRTTTHWGTFDFEVRDGKAVSAAALDDDPAAGRMARGLADTFDHPLRITRPHVRQGWLEHGPRYGGNRRGAEPMVEVGWAEAYDLIAAELTRIRDRHGDQAVYGGSYGWGSAGRFHHPQSQIHRFLNVDGGYTASKNTYSFAALEVLLPHLIGGSRLSMIDWNPQWSEIRDHCRIVVAFGGSSLKNTQVNHGGLRRHRIREAQVACFEAGVRFVLVSPHRDDLAAELGAEWVPIRPGTDTAMLLAMTQHLVASGLADRDFLDACCVGFPELARYLNGEDDGVVKSPEWAEPITGVPAGTMRELAEACASQRSVVSLTWSIQRAQHGEQPYWAGLSLAAAAGSMGRPGGGYAVGLGGEGGVGMHRSSIGVASFPQGTNPVETFIPVARISDMLLNPGAELAYDGRTLTYPDIRMIYWAGGNPFHHHQDLNKLVRAWNVPETVVVHDSWWTPVTRFADIVIPVASSLERDDIAAGAHDNHLLPMHRIQDPPAGVPTDFEAFREIAKRRGRAEEFTEGLDTEAWVRRLYAETVDRLARRGVSIPDFDEFMRSEGVEVPLPAQRDVFGDLRADPQRFPLTTPSGRIEIFSSTIAGFDLEGLPGHAVWREPEEWLGSSLAEGGEHFHLLSHQPRGRLHSQLDFGASSQSTKIGGREAVQLNPADAARLGVGDGDVVRLVNDRGSCLAAAKISSGVTAGVLLMATGGWYDPQQPGEPDATCLQGNPNVLTSDRPTSQLAQGPTAQTCLVRVEVIEDPPASRAYLPPAVAQRTPTG